MRLALYVCLKNICDGVGCQNGSNGTPLDPPLFWRDNIFKMSIKNGAIEADLEYIEIVANKCMRKKLLTNK